jgi:DNA-directed RNA polymerase II subunit RPB1
MPPVSILEANTCLRPRYDRRFPLCVAYPLISVPVQRRMSAAEINSAIMYEGKMPKDGGLLDLHLGTNDRSLRCKTCGADQQYCAGHFGHIELARPVYHIGFLAFVHRVLRCVCYNCSGLLIGPVRVLTLFVVGMRLRIIV